ncbi:MAG TPA: cation diffusion facilitator family transporter [Polyangia bacterium]|nr:cation diffusion facilitator family transporter [Polyangia bacterium]
MSADPTSHILQALLVNVIITLAKGVAAVFTGSGALLAEAIHTGADCANQVLLLLGIRQASRPPDATHPLGYGRNLYFWSFIVALLLFTGGGVFSIYEGVHKLHEPEPVERVWLGFLILGFSLLLEGGSTLSNIKELRARASGAPFFQFLRDTKDSDLVVVFGENAAASLGLILAMAALGAAAATGDSRWDGVGSLLVGMVLVGVAIFLGTEIKALLVGESADPGIAATVREIAGTQPLFRRVLHLITIQQGPGEVVVLMKAAFTDGASIETVSAAINTFEAALRARRPDIRWCFVEPDVDRDRAPAVEAARA